MTDTAFNCGSEAKVSLVIMRDYRRVILDLQPDTICYQPEPVTIGDYFTRRRDDKWQIDFSMGWQEYERQIKALPWRYSHTITLIADNAILYITHFAWQEDATLPELLRIIMTYSDGSRSENRFGKIQSANLFIRERAGLEHLELATVQMRSERRLVNSALYPALSNSNPPQQGAGRTAV